MHTIKHFFFMACCALALQAHAGLHVLGDFSDQAPPNYRGSSWITPAEDSFGVKRISPKCDNCRSYYLVELNGRTVSSHYYSAGEIGRGDYNNVRYIIVSTQAGEKSDSLIQVFADNGKTWDITAWWSNVGGTRRTAGVTRDGKVLKVQESEIASYDLFTKATVTIQLPSRFIDARFATDGEYFGIMGLDHSSRIWMGNGAEWTKTPQGILGEFGDRENVIGFAIKGQDEYAGVAYANMNAYNKGVLLVHGRLGQPARHAWAINSDEKNYGFSPAIHWSGETLTIVGKNSSDKKTFAIRIPEQTMRSMTYTVPTHAAEHQASEVASAMVGVSVAKMVWNAKSKVEGMSDVNYEIASALFKGANIEGKYRNRNVAISYLKSETEEVAAQSGGSIAKEASSFLFAYMDLDSKFSASHTMRLTLEKADLKGVASYRASGSTTVSEEKFNNQYLKLGVYDIGERGSYFKMELAQSKLPVAVGFGNNGTSSVSFFEPEARFLEFSLGWGYDELAYAKRYESSYSNWYVSGSGSIGLGQLNITDRIEQQAKAALGKDVEGSKIYIGLHMNLETGYLIQRRSRWLRGLGQSFTAGIRVQADRVGSSAGSDKDDGKKGKIEIQRTDYLIGPFLRYNLVF